MFTDTIAQFGLVQFLLSSNTIVEWQAFGSLNPTFELGSVGSTDPAILAAFQSHALPPSTGVGDAVGIGGSEAQGQVCHPRCWSFVDYFIIGDVVREDGSRIFRRDRY